MTPLLLRAAARVIIRVLAKAFAYGAVIAAVVWAIARVPSGVVVGAVALWALAALWVFRDKVREEMQRIGGRS